MSKQLKIAGMFILTWIIKINLNLPFDFQRVAVAKIHEKEPPHFLKKIKMSKYFWTMNLIDHFYP